MIHFTQPAIVLMKGKQGFTKGGISTQQLLNLGSSFTTMRNQLYNQK